MKQAVLANAGFCKCSEQGSGCWNIGQGIGGQPLDLATARSWCEAAPSPPEKVPTKVYNRFHLAARHFSAKSQTNDALARRSASSICRCQFLQLAILQLACCHHPELRFDLEAASSRPWFPGEALGQPWGGGRLLGA